jgi:hypothetical protein
VIYIRIKAGVAKLAPGLNDPRKFKGGEMVTIRGHIDYPGSALHHGNVFQQWAFWDCFDPDTALIFHIEDISEILVSEGDPRRELLATCPIPVNVLRKVP